MVLGVRSKNKKNPAVQVDYLINIQDVKPWPPSQSLRTVRSVLIQWEHGEKTSGCTDPVVPSLGSGSDIGDGRIEFNESFKLHTTLIREMHIKSDGDAFLKNCIEFNLYEPRRDKTVKGQLLATAVVDFADYGVIKETLSISVPMNCKRSYRNTAQPLLFLRIRPVEKNHNGSSSKDSLLREASMDKNGGESISSLMNEEYAEEAEIASFTDDDISSHSSLVLSSSVIESNGVSSPNDMNGSIAMTHCPEVAKHEYVLPSKEGLTESDGKMMAESHGSLKGSAFSSSTDLSSDLAFISKRIRTNSIQSLSSLAHNGGTEELNTNACSGDLDSSANSQEKAPSIGIEVEGTLRQDISKIIADSPIYKKPALDTSTKSNGVNFYKSQVDGPDDENTLFPSVKGMDNAAVSGNADDCPLNNENGDKNQNGQETQLCNKQQILEGEPLDNFSLDDIRKQNSVENDAFSVSRENQDATDNILNMDRSKHSKSVRSLTDISRSNGSARNNQFHKEKDVNYPGGVQTGARSLPNNEMKDNKVNPKETRNTFADSKIHQLENRIKILEGELREAATIEHGLFSVIAEHGSSISKVHAPARRLSRLYLHSHNEYSQSRRGSAAQNAISGFVLVAKACGHDVPRLTFWLSNSIVLRAIVSRAFREKQHLPGTVAKRSDDRKGNNKKLSSLKWESSLNRDVRSSLSENFDDWEDPYTFVAALEKIEAWIFSRIVESIWWQALTPHMQSTSINKDQDSDSGKINRLKSSSGDQEQGAFSIELWKRAFRDACKKICPIRGGGHECGCLPVLSRLIMEQCVARLDVAMLNAILRYSADEIPTDPMSDPISDVKVLPIPTGIASFGAGAQLKNAIGNWSRCLTDLCGIDDDDSLEDENGHDDTDEVEKGSDTSFKPFHLLNALSDLMMLPKDMLLSSSIRKEVCPAFGSSLIQRVLNIFTPDEFCPDPIPEVVLKALDSEGHEGRGEDDGTNFPCTATRIFYQPPSAAAIIVILESTGSDQSRLRRSGSSVLKKSHTSDDELDELDSPLKSIIMDNSRVSPGRASTNWSRNAVRYQLLRELWMNCE